MKVLALDDQRSARHVLASICRDIGDVTVVEIDAIEHLEAALSHSPIDVAFIDLRLSSDPRDRRGLKALSRIKEASRAVPVMLTAHGDLTEVRAAMRAGAYDYLLKEDLCEETVRPILEHARTLRRLEDEVLQHRAKTGGAPSPLIGTSAPMRQLDDALLRVGVSDRPVLVLGPSGSGKELVARRVHALGKHPEAPFLDLNCAAIPEQLIEAQLFGYEKGAFTGADRRSAGFFEATKNGTLFLDEVAELPLTLQAKLLRVLEQRAFRPVGSTEERRFEGRLVAATHADLEERVSTGRFREDLFHRLDVLRVRVPALSERREDIPQLLAHFAAQQTPPLRFSADAMALLQRAPWSGNVRELRNVVDRIAVFADGPDVDAALAQAHLRGGPSVDVTARLAKEVLNLAHDGDKLALLEKTLVAAALSQAGGNKTEAARLLGVHRKTIERRVNGDDDDEA